ncbi:hypothetical protein [Flavobacterium sp.]|uniref:hypothetical protein n=1 Tax=Flavobacterium sp. TaxID=239 RepID=UPI0012212495|nr:hypothetical protein [Flavobacterium sp.]RZJ72950.1 MAG: hypothetical protein EOO49_04785 [Flavobacterium sp.]
MFHIVVIILFLPIASQLILGSFSIAQKINLKYSVITQINIAVAIALLIAAPKLLDVEAKIEHVRSIMPRTTYYTLAIFLFLAFLSVIGFQLVWKKGHKKRLNRD